MPDRWQTYPIEFRGGLISNLSPLQHGSAAPGLFERPRLPHQLDLGQLGRRILPLGRRPPHQHVEHGEQGEERLRH